MGYIENQEAQAVEQVALQVSTSRQTYHLVVNQRFIPPGGRAPYHILINPENELYLTENLSDLTFSLSRAKNSAGQVYTAPITSSTGQMVDGHYQIKANLGDVYPARAIQAVAMLYDDEGRVLGYRILEYEDIPETIEVNITPQIPDTPLTYSLYIIGREKL